MRHFALSLSLSLSLFLSPLASPQAEVSLPAFEPAACPFIIPGGERIECGFLVVPENRARPEGPSIRLGVAVIHSHTSSPQPDPFIQINGGPAGSVVQSVPDLLAMYRPLLGRGDVVLYDQRGAGWSQPALHCPEVSAAGQSPEALKSAYLACRDRWLAQGVDLAAYSTSENAADAHDLWRALGYEQVNLYGVSYGAVLAQVILQAYPEEIRSVILDSAYPLGANLLADSARSWATFRDELFAACEADWACRISYPDLAGAYQAVLDRLAAEPVTLSVPDSAVSFSFDAAAFLGALARQPFRQAPAFIYDVRDGDYSAVIRLMRADQEAQAVGLTGLSLAARISVMCSDPVLGGDPTGAAPHLAGYAFPLQVCAGWPGSRPAANPPLHSDIPTLVLNGQFDLSVPPAYDALLGQALTRGQVFRVPRSMHGVLGPAGACGAAVADAFLRDPEAPLDTACLAEAGRLPLNTVFAVRAAAVRGPALGLALLLGLVVLAGGLGAARHLLTRPRAFSLRQSLRAINWLPLLGGAALIGLGLLRGEEPFMWMPLSRAVETLLPLFAALQAALLFAPEDEPGLEMALACPRPLAWTVLERFGLALAAQVTLGAVLSLWAGRLTGETLGEQALRWLPPLLCFSGMALGLTLVTRRSIFSLAVVTLVWFAAAMMSDLVVQYWSFAWPLVPYPPADHADFNLNRWVILLIGLTAATASVRYLGDEERLLLGGRGGSRGRRVRQVELDPDPSRWGALDPAYQPKPHRLAQLAGMLSYEFRLQWRRRAVSVMMLSMIALPVLGALALGRSLVTVAADGLPREDLTPLVMTQMQPSVWGVVWGFLVLLLPVVVAENIPRDRQMGVRELLDSLPVLWNTYLLGKLLSLWAMLLAGLALAAVVLALVWGLGVGPFDGEWYVRMWLVGAIPMALTNPSVSLLLAAGQPSSRRALVVGIGFAVALMICMGIGFTTLTHPWNVHNPGRLIVLLHFMITPGSSSDLLSLSLSPYVGTAALQASLLWGLAQVAAVWALVWAWEWRREHRA